ncbi:hypothetical protein HELRODRAFT_96116 [Helobdella robusta]|uniref:NR LBD domain-containing protein n=1 Tax=Helobdella robusta TaxID=6412 RepID=T1G9A4_HELRO|nr:hypothetical protein HELRODRAFT_96116 [Helobdella robusta]ESN92973.1 hypothetical protein HELRODRAFT_96116 [Helobdella robusta]
MNSLKGRRGRLPSKGRLSQMGHFELPQINLASELVKAHNGRTAESHTAFRESSDLTECSQNEIIRHFYAGFVQQYEALKAWSEKILELADVSNDDKKLLFDAAFLELLSYTVAKNLSGAQSFIPLTSRLLLPKDKFSKEFSEWVDLIVQYSSNLNKLSLDATSTACMEALILITDRVGLKDSQLVDKLQWKVCETLYEHIQNTYEDTDRESPVLSRILGALPQIRSISMHCLRLLQKLETSKPKIPQPALVKHVFLSKSFSL